MFVEKTGPSGSAPQPPGTDRVAAGFECFSGDVVGELAVAPARRRPAWAQLEQALCSWPARWISVLVAVFTLSSWTDGNVGAPSRVLIMMLVLAGVLALTTRPGWQLLRLSVRAEHLVGALGACSEVVFLLLVLQVVLAGPLTGADLAVSRLAAGLPHGTLYQVAELVSVIAQVPVQAGVLLILAAVLARRSRRWRPLLIAAAALMLVGVTVGAGKLLLGRGRPAENVQALHVGGSSFPSGHTTAAVVLAGMAVWLIGQHTPRVVRRLGQVLAVMWAVLIGVDRLYLDVHWLTDVLAGWALGAALLCLLISADRSVSRIIIDARPGRDARTAHSLRPLHLRGEPAVLMGHRPADRPVDVQGPPGPPSPRRSPRTADQRRWLRWLRRGLWTVGSMGLAAVLGVTALAVLTPSGSDAEAQVRTLAAAHGTVDSAGAVPPLFARALIASEDARFYSDHGIDLQGLLRAASTALHGGVDQGGATLDQQLAKQLYTAGQGSIGDKVTQMAVAVKLDASYSKAQILEMYAATVYFGAGFYGLPAASCGYFAVPPSRLTQGQAAMLVGLPAPSNYNPITNMALARQRQRHVLDRLVAVGALTPQQAAADYAAALQLHPAPARPARRC